jgi:hypothetical protein
LDVSVQAEGEKPTLSVERHDQTIEIKHSAEQNFGYDDFFYAMWVKKKAQCGAGVNEKHGSFTDIKPPSEKGSVFCVLRTKKSLGADWQRYAVSVTSEPPGERGPVNAPPIDLPPKSPKTQKLKCVLETSGTDNTETCTVKF